MRRLLIALFVLVPALVLSAAQKDEKEKEKPKAGLHVGGNLPGPFHPFNLNGKYDGRFHCPISEQDLDPTILILTREIDPTAALKDLVEQATKAAVKNRDTRLSVVVVFLHKLDTSREDPLGKNKEVEKGLEADATLEKQNTIEDNRLELVEKLKPWLNSVNKGEGGNVPEPAPGKAEGEMKKFAVKEPLLVGIADTSDVASYKLADSDKTVVILYSKLEIKGLFVFEVLKEDDVKGIMTQVADKLGAVRK